MIHRQVKIQRRTTEIHKGIKVSNMIGDFLQFLEYYGTETGVPSLPYTDPLIRIEYDAINKDGELVLALMAPFSHAINALCYREQDAESYYNQRNIAQICQVSSSEVTAWKKEERIPEKYRWFLLLVDISENAGNMYGHKLLHTNSQHEAEKICDIYLRMIKCCFDPFCKDDCVLAAAVRSGCGLAKVTSELLAINPDYWEKILKIHSS